MTKYTQGLQVPPASYACSPALKKNRPMKGVIFLRVPEAGLEPAPLTRHDFESCAATITPLRLMYTVFSHK